jgi:hypothetical protein
MWLPITSGGKEQLVTEYTQADRTASWSTVNISAMADRVNDYPSFRVDDFVQDSVIPYAKLEQSSKVAR